MAGQSLSELQIALAYGYKSRNAITFLYQDLLRRDPNDAEIRIAQDGFASSRNFLVLHIQLAYSEEARSGIINFYQQVAERTPSSSELQQAQDGLASSQTLLSERRELAGRDEIRDKLRNLYQTLLGISPVPTGTLESAQSELATSKDFAYFRSALQQIKNQRDSAPPSVSSSSGSPPSPTPISPSLVPILGGLLFSN